MDNRPEIAHRGVLLENYPVAGGGWRHLKISLSLPGEPLPGQFVQLRLDRGTDPLLRRPFSIHHADPENGTMALLVRVAGPGTARIAGFHPGIELDLLGPFGRGFPFLDEESPALLVAGGIGLAPLFFAADYRIKRKLPVEFLIGAKTADALPDQPYFESFGLLPLVSTDDGSRGMKGTAVDLMCKRLEAAVKPTRIHACGPLPLLASVARTGIDLGIPTHLSLESRLACAVGACLGCAFPIRKNGTTGYRRVCRDGPVFDGEDVVFET